MFDQNHNFWPHFSVPPQNHQLIDPFSCMSSKNCNAEGSCLVSVGNATVVVYTVQVKLRNSVYVCSATDGRRFLIASSAMSLASK